MWSFYFSREFESKLLKWKTNEEFFSSFNRFTIFTSEILLLLSFMVDFTIHEYILIRLKVGEWVQKLSERVKRSESQVKYPCKSIWW